METTLLKDHFPRVTPLTRTGFALRSSRNSPMIHPVHQYVLIAMVSITRYGATWGVSREGMHGVNLAAEQWLDGHQFATYDIDVDALIDALAVYVKNLYIEPDVLQRTLEQASAGLEDVVDRSSIDGILAEVTRAVVPRPGTNTQRPWLDLARNEVAEVLAYAMAEELYGVVIASKRVRNKEVSAQPSRGVDLVGLLESSQLTLVCGEVKASESQQSPPPVVGVGDDSLRAQLTRLSTDRDRITQELNWAHKHASSTDQPLVARAILLWAKDRLDVTLLPVLIRPENRASESDYGCFLEDRTDFLPAAIRFCLARVPIPLDEFAQRVYNQARDR